MRVLVVRPRKQAEATARRLALRGHAALVAPVLSIEPVAEDADPDGRDAAALLVTSQNAVPAAIARLGLFADKPVFAVGARTGRALAEAGFRRVSVAAGSGAALARLVADALPPGTPLLHLAGRNRRPEPARSLGRLGFPLSVREVYAAEAAPVLPPDLRDALREGGLDAALHYSPRSTTVLAGLVETAGLGAAFARLDHLCLSGEVAAALPAVGAARLHVASEPSEDALLAALDRVAAEAGAARLAPPAGAKEAGTIPSERACRTADGDRSPMTETKRPDPLRREPPTIDLKKDEFKRETPKGGVAADKGGPAADKGGSAPAPSREGERPKGTSPGGAASPRGEGPAGPERSEAAKGAEPGGAGGPVRPAVVPPAQAGSPAAARSDAAAAARSDAPAKGDLGTGAAGGPKEAARDPVLPAKGAGPAAEAARSSSGSTAPAASGPLSGAKPAAVAAGPSPAPGASLPGAKPAASGLDARTSAPGAASSAGKPDLPGMAGKSVSPGAPAPAAAGKDAPVGSTGAKPGAAKGGPGPLGGELPASGATGPKPAPAAAVLESASVADGGTRAADSRRRGGAGGWVAAGLVGGLIGAGLTVGAERYLAAGQDTVESRVAALESRPASGPDREAAAELGRRLAALENGRAELGRQVAAAQGAAEAARNAATSGGAAPDPALRQAVDAVSARVSAAEEASRAAEAARNEALDALRGRIEATDRKAETGIRQATEAAETLRSGLGEVRSRLDGVAGTVQSLRGDLGTLRNRVETADAKNGEQDARIAANASDLSKLSPAAVQAGLRVVVADRLLDALRTGAPIGAPVASLDALGADREAIGALKAAAGSDIPSVAGLLSDFRPIADRLTAEPQTPPSSFGDRLLRIAEKAVTVRAIGDGSGNDVPGLVARIEAALTRGAVADALSAWEKLPDASKELSSGWAERLRRRAAIEAAARRVAEQSLSALDQAAAR